MKKITELLVITFMILTGTMDNMWAQSDGLPRGAYMMPYNRYEADSGSLGGGAILKGPSFDQAVTASEASGKKYVELPNAGSYVSWTLQHKAGGMVLRFTMPDSENGTGLYGRLDIYVNDVLAGNLPVSSYHGWQYFDKSQGSDRHPSNDPAVGTPRMHFDEERFKFPEKLSPGDVIRLQKPEDNGIPYGIDFIEVEEIEEPITKPEGYIDVTQPPFNAVPDDAGDDYQAIAAALEQAHLQQTGIYIPPGKFLLGNRLNLQHDNTSVVGAGIWHTELRFTSTSKNYGGIYAHASYIHVSDLYLTTAINLRDSYRAFGECWGKNSVIGNVWLTHFSVGLWIADYTAPYNITDGLTVRNCRIRNTYADGCNFAKGSSNCILEHCDVRNNCDDGLATWSSDKDKLNPTTHNTFRFNTIEFVVRAAGVGIFGGQQHLAHHCIMRDIYSGAGIRVNSTFDAWPFSDSSFIRIFEMTVEWSGTRYELWDNKIGALDFHVRYYDVQNVKFSNIDVYHSQADGIYMNSANCPYSMKKIYFDDILLHGAACDQLGPGYGIYASDNLKGNIYTTNVKIEGSMTGNIYEQASAFEIVNISTAGNQRPVANAGEDMTLAEGTTSFQLDGTASHDPESGQLLCEWIQVAGPPVTIDNPGAVEPLISNLSPNKIFIFRLMVHDGILGDADAVTIKTGTQVSMNKMQPDNTSAMKIYPNPSGNYFQVDLAGSLWQTATLKIWNMTGSCVRAGQLMRGDLVDVSSLQAGMYVVSLQLEEGSFREVFVKGG